MEVGLKSIFRAVKRAVPHIRASGGGSIVNIASVHGLLMAPEKLAYETVKSAVIGMTKQMACDFGPDGIRVNAICPGHIVTERGQAHWEKIRGCMTCLSLSIRYGERGYRTISPTRSGFWYRRKPRLSQGIRWLWTAD